VLAEAVEISGSNWHTLTALASARLQVSALTSQDQVSGDAKYDVIRVRSATM
jgi:hypothetical protein